MNTVSQLRIQALKELAENVNEQAFIPRDGSPAYIRMNGKKAFMPAYIPYVGPEYFTYRPRILCYAINQNLSRHRTWSSQWMTEWSMDSQCAIDRLNHAAACGRALPIKPYAEGFIPLAALLGLKAYLSHRGRRLPASIDSVIAVTNFVKFSTSDSASSSEIPDSWWSGCGYRYVRREIEILKPDVIVTFGKRTFVELNRVISNMDVGGDEIDIMECRFPGRIPSVKARPVRGQAKRLWDDDILPLAERIMEPPADGFAKWRMTRFPGYFVDIAREWAIG
ncbi:hypothetical protein ACFLQR_00405 [Verrucomicrobiota bacterium]